jgi:hypothetical protein
LRRDGGIAPYPPIQFLPGYRTDCQSGGQIISCAEPVSGNDSAMRENVQPELTLEQLRTLLPDIEKDFDTPEGAILCLEDAYRRQNIESACICKNFMIEGTLKLLDLDPNLARDPEMRKKNARLLELSYRKATAESWPDLKGVESFFIDRQVYTDGIVVVVEIRRSPDGTFTRLNHLVAKTKDGWKVLNEVSDE